MSDGALMVVLIFVTCGVLWLAGKFIIGPLLGLGLDAAERVTRSVAGKAKDVAASTGHSIGVLALRAQSKKLVKMGLEVADRTTSVNELGLDADLSRKNDELAERIASRAFDGLGELPSTLPSPQVLATYALLQTATELSAGNMREKLRIAGQAVAMLVKEGAAPPDAFSVFLMRQCSDFVAQLNSDAFIDAFEKS